MELILKNNDMVLVDGRPAHLTPLEYQILACLMSQPGRKFTSAELYERIWGGLPVDCEGLVAVHIRHLREKIEEQPGQPRHIRMRRRSGYYYDA